MIRTAFDVLLAAAVMGAVLGVLYLRGAAASRPHPALAPAHGVVGLAGFALLVAALRHGLPASDTGTSGFGAIAAACFAVALGFGLLIAWMAWRRGRPAGLAVAIHASLAIGGLVVLLALIALA